MYPLGGTGPVPSRRLTSGVDDNIDAENNIIDRKRLTQALINLHQYVSRQNGRRLAQVSCVNPQTRDEKCICGSKLTHTELDICAPVGFGVNLTLRVSSLDEEALVM